MTGLSEEGEPRTGLRVSDFDFELPTELIAQQPPAERGQSRMLVMNRATGAVRDSAFAEFPSLLNPGDLLVLNDTRVIPHAFTPAAQQCATSRMAHKLSVPHPCAFFLAQGGKPRPSTGVSSTAGCPGPGSPRTGLRPWGGGPDFRTWESTHPTGRIEVMLTEPAASEMLGAHPFRVLQRKGWETANLNQHRAKICGALLSVRAERLLSARSSSSPIPQAASRLKPRFSSAANSVSACCASTQ